MNAQGWASLWASMKLTTCYLSTCGSYENDLRIEIDFPKGSIWHDGVSSETLVFLVIPHKMLDYCIMIKYASPSSKIWWRTCGYTLGLQPVHISSSHDTWMHTSIMAAYFKRQVIMIPERWGSSEKDSKARPPRGFLWILQVGASRRTDDLALASSAKNSPAFWISSGSKVDAREVEHCSQLNVGSLEIKRFGLQEGIEWELKQSEMILERPKTTTIKGTTTVTH